MPVKRVGQLCGRKVTKKAVNVDNKVRQKLAGVSLGDGSERVASRINDVNVAGQIVVFTVAAARFNHVKIDARGHDFTANLSVPAL